MFACSCCSVQDSHVLFTGDLRSANSEVGRSNCSIIEKGDCDSACKLSVATNKTRSILPKCASHVAPFK